MDLQTLHWYCPAGQVVAEHMDIGTDRIVTVRDIRENNGRGYLIL